MIHQRQSAFGPIERKGEEDEATDLVTKAVTDLTKTVNERLADIEKKADTTKLVERLDKLEAKGNRPNGGGTEEKVEPTVERKAFAAYLRHGSAAPADELKVLTVASDPQGGFLAPSEMSSEFIRNLVEFSPIRAVASVRQTTSPSVIYPTRTGITNAKWKGEIELREPSEPAFGQLEVPVKTLATYVELSNELLADSAGQAEAEVRLALAEDFAQKEALAFLVGNGVIAPEGLLTRTDIPTTVAASATAFITDELISLMYAVPAPYRNNGTWALNSTLLSSLRKIKDGNGAYIWQAALTEGQPETILGRPVIEMLDMPDTAANAIPIVYGDFSGYRIVDRLEMSILVDPYSRATNGITRIHATRRVGGAVIQPKKFRFLKMAAS